MWTSIPTQRLLSLRHLVSKSSFMSQSLLLSSLFLCCEILDASSGLGTTVLPTNRPRQTTLTFSQGHLNIVKSTPQLRAGEFF